MTTVRWRKSASRYKISWSGTYSSAAPTPNKIAKAAPVDAPRVDAQRKRIRQHIAHHGLQNCTGDRQTCTDRNAQKQTRQADIPHDGIGGLKLSWQSGAEKMMRGNRAQVGDIQRGRPDNDAESKDCDQGAKNNS